MFIIIIIKIIDFKQIKRIIVPMQAASLTLKEGKR